MSVGGTLGYFALLAGLVVSLLIRLPHGRRHQSATLAESRKDTKENALMMLVFASMYLLPVVALITPVFQFAEYTLYSPVFFAGVVILVFSQYLFWRTHADLGINWSPSLDIKKSHALVDTGVYRSVRHPMYTSMFFWASAQLLLIPNWFVGPSGLIAFTLLFIARVNSEEKMMVDNFGEAYVNYMRRTKRLLPYIY